MSQRSRNSRLLPEGLVTRCSKQTKADCFAEFGDAPWLMIRVDDVESEFAVALSEAPSGEGAPLTPSYRAIDFATISSESHEAAAAAVAKRRQIRLKSP